MSNRLIKIFEDEKLVEKIKRRLPYLFQPAELESSRAGKTGMEVGSVRERIIVALLIYKFGEANVETEIHINDPEVDVKLFGKPVPIWYKWRYKRWMRHKISKARECSKEQKN